MKESHTKKTLLYVAYDDVSFAKLISMFSVVKHIQIIDKRQHPFSTYAKFPSKHPDMHT